MACYVALHNSLSIFIALHIAWLVWSVQSNWRGRNLYRLMISTNVAGSI